MKGSWDLGFSKRLLPGNIALDMVLSFMGVYGM